MVRVDVETDQTLSGCPDCGVVAIGHGRRVQVLHDAPCFGRPVRVRWFKRIWRCGEESCPRQTWTEQHPFAAKRAKLTARAVGWAVDALRHDDTTVAALARRLGVAWDTCWNAIAAAAKELVKQPGRVDGHQDHRGRRAHLAAEQGRPRSKRPSRSWSLDPRRARLPARAAARRRPGPIGEGLCRVARRGRCRGQVTVEHAALDPFRGYINAI